MKDPQKVFEPSSIAPETLSSLNISDETAKSVKTLIMENLNFVLSNRNSPFNSLKPNSLTGLASTTLYSGSKPPENLDDLISKIAKQSGIDKPKLTTYLNAMRAISSSNPTAIDDFFKYHGELILQKYHETIHQLSPYEDSNFLTRIANIFTTNPTAFNEESLQKWLQSRYCDTEIKDNLKDENYRFVQELIKTSPQKISAGETKNNFEEIGYYLERNIDFFQKLYSVKKTKYGQFLLDNFFDELNKSNSAQPKFTQQQICSLKDNFATELSLCKSLLDKGSIEPLIDSPILKLISLIDDNIENYLRDEFLPQFSGTAILLESQEISKFSSQLPSPFSSFKFRQDFENLFNKKTPTISPSSTKTESTVARQSISK
jgi:hypothetical protein